MPQIWHLINERGACQIHFLAHFLAHSAFWILCCGDNTGLFGVPKIKVVDLQSKNQKSDLTHQMEHLIYYMGPFSKEEKM